MPARLTEFWRRVRFFFRRGSAERELEEEFEQHLAMQADVNRAGGMNPQDARYDARRRFGNGTLLKEKSRDVWGWRWLETIGQDLRYALRILLASPGFTAVAVLSLSLGIAVNTIVFSFLNALLIRPLPYPGADRLVGIFNVPQKQRGAQEWASTGDIVHWRERNRVFEQIELFSNPDDMTLTSQGEPQRVRMQYVTPAAFRMLGVRPAMGSWFADVGRQGTIVILSHNVWRRAFRSDPGIVGKKIVADGRVYTAVGVMPRGFDFFGKEDTDFWNPMPVDIPAWQAPTWRGFFAAGRLKPGVSIQTAQAQMEVMGSQLAREYPETNKEMTVAVRPLQEALFGNMRMFMYPVFGAVAFVLLIACTNVANLLLSRAAARQREMGIRAALGASRARLARQTLTESLVLALAGGGVGLGLSMLGIRLFALLVPSWFPRSGATTIDHRVLGFTLAVSVLTGILFGLAPAWQAARVDLIESLKEGGGRFLTPLRRRARSALVVVEMALALVLLACVGLMINMFVRLVSVNPGFDAAKVLTFEIWAYNFTYLDISTWPQERFRPALDAYYRRVVERVQALPGVESAAIVDTFPMLEDANAGSRTFTTARPLANGASRAGALFTAVSPDYFRVMRIPLLKGRLLSGQDTESSPWAVVINEAMARRYWGNQDPIGEFLTVQTRGAQERPRQIVGIVGSVRQRLEREPFPEMYLPFWQQPDVCYDGSNYVSVRVHKNVVLRTRVAPMKLAETARRAVWDLDRNLAVYHPQTLAGVMTTSAAGQVFYLRLLGVFAGFALVLAAIGIYGVISYSVSERSHAIGVRLALGARRWQVVWLLLKEGAVVALFGIIIGLAGSWAVTPLLAQLLYGVKPHDALTLVLVSLFLLAIALAATYIPARRASRIEPMVTLRHE